MVSDFLRHSDFLLSRSLISYRYFSLVLFIFLCHLVYVGVGWMGSSLLLWWRGRSWSSREMMYSRHVYVQEHNKRGGFHVSIIHFELLRYSCRVKKGQLGCHGLVQLQIWLPRAGAVDASYIFCEMWRGWGWGEGGGGAFWIFPKRIWCRLFPLFLLFSLAVCVPKRGRVTAGVLLCACVAVVVRGKGAQQLDVVYTRQLCVVACWCIGITGLRLIIWYKLLSNVPGFFLQVCRYSCNSERLQQKKSSSSIMKYNTE